MTIKLFLSALVVHLMLAAAASGQEIATRGFAGLGNSAEGFEAVVPGREVQFPDDFGPHPEFRIEWWYVTANLTAENGQVFGAQWTLFRQATKPGTANPAPSEWSSSEFWMGHAALTSADRHYSAEKIARGGIGQAGAKPVPFETWIDDWSFAAIPTSSDEPPAYHINASGKNFSYALDMIATGPMVLQGDNGYSVKSDQGQASYYFSNPFLKASGSLTIDGQELKVTGDAWLDREWSSQPLAAGQQGWDWFSLKFDGGEKLMLFGLRGATGEPFKSATWITPDGQSEKLDGASLQMRPLRFASIAGKNIPVEWLIEIPSKKVSLTVKALNDNSWMTTSISYWEGPVMATGSHRAKGYLEMTGY